MELYVARHGQTVSNSERRMQGSGDSPLTENGIEQAKELMKTIENIDFDAAYSSSLNRAVETAKIALGNRYTIKQDNRLVEFGLGIMEGMPVDEVAIAYPESANLFMSDPVSYKTPIGGESLNEIIARVDSFLNEIISLNYNKVFVLSHGFTMRVLFACTLDKAIPTIAKAPRYANCELVRYIYNGGEWIHTHNE